jgi:hypothetical protein
MLGDEARPASKSAARAPVAVLALYVLTLIRSWLIGAHRFVDIGDLRPWHRYRTVCGLFVNESAPVVSDFPVDGTVWSR